MSRDEELRRARVLEVLKQKDVKSAKDLASAGTAMYMNIYKQLFSEGVKTLSLDVIGYILEKFPDVSSEYIMRGNGTWDRNPNIVTTAKQEIHVDGGQAAISQSGSAMVEAQNDHPSELFTPAEIAKWVSEGNVGALVGVILAQKDEIIRLKEKRIADLEHSMHLCDNQLFPDVR